MSKRKKITFSILSILAIKVGLYPLIGLSTGMQFDLLTTQSAQISGDTLWKIGFYSHIIFGGIALLMGWIQFIKMVRLKFKYLHRWLGKIYVVTAIGSGIGGIYISLFSDGGIISAVGFISLGLIWLYTTSKAYLEIRKENVLAHKSMMIYSYAACFAAVTLRILLPLLKFIMEDFELAYSIVAWISWIPNLLVAHLLIKKDSVL